MKTAESNKDFEQELKDLIKTCGGVPPKEGWFEDVQKNHEKIREYIGSLEVETKVTITDGQGKLDKKQCNEILDKLGKAWPRFTQKFTGSYCFKPDFLELPEKPSGSHSVQKVTQYLSSWIEYDRNMGYATKENVDSYNKVLSELGNLWKKAQTEKQTLKVGLYTDAMAFLKIGHYSVDDGSCFAQDGGNYTHKWVLGATPNTYVILIENESGKILARLWGFASKNFKVWNFCNLYFGNGANAIREGNVVAAIKAFLVQFLGETINVTPEKIFFKGEGLYINPYFKMTFSPYKDIDNQYIIIDKKYRQLNDATCVGCGEEFDVNETYVIDQERYCYDCSEGCTVLIDGARTFSDDITEVIHNQYGDHGYVRSRDAENYELCGNCEILIGYANRIAPIGDHKFCTSVCKKEFQADQKEAKAVKVA